MSRIHPTAIVDPKAEVDASVEIGAYAVVGPHVQLAEGVALRPHAHVTGHTSIGPSTRIFSFASIGEEPQDLKYRGEPTRLRIGARNTIREHVTMNPGTGTGGGETTVGDDNLFMIGVHIAHDSHVGNHVIMANQASLAGHVVIEDHAFLAGMCGVHQFVRIGESAMLAAMSGVGQDVAPFAIAQGNHARILGLNRINLERRGFSKDRIGVIDKAFRIIFRSKLLPQEAFARVREELAGSPDAEHLVAFLEKSERGFCRMR